MITGLWREHDGDRIVNSSGAISALAFHDKWIAEFQRLNVFTKERKKTGQISAIALYLLGMSNRLSLRDYVNMVDDMTEGLLMIRPSRDEQGRCHGINTLHSSTKEQYNKANNAWADGNRKVISGKKVVADVSIHEYKLKDVAPRAAGLHG